MVLLNKENKERYESTFRTASKKREEENTHITLHTPTHSRSPLKVGGKLLFKILLLKTNGGKGLLEKLNIMNVRMNPAN